MAHDLAPLVVIAAMALLLIMVACDHSCTAIGGTCVIATDGATVDAASEGNSDSGDPDAP